MKTFADVESRLAEVLPGYESRPPQQRLAEGVERLFSVPEHFTSYAEDPDEYWDWNRGATHFLGQAGTGVGKSLGYLIPAILSGRRVVVSVTTKALQDQLASKDLPFLEQHLDKAFSWTMLKGRSNYLCLNRLATATDSEVPMMAQILQRAGDSDFDGLRESLGFEVPHSAWYRACSVSEDCSADSCKADRCYAARARSIAAASQIVVVNHALFFSDLLLKTYGTPGILPEYEAVVFDEAHEVEEIAANSLGGSLTHQSFIQIANEARNWAVSYANDGVEVLGDTISAMTASAAAMFEVVKVGRIRMQQLDEMVVELTGIYDTLQDFRLAFVRAKYDNTPDYERAQKRKASISRKIASLQSRITQVVADPFAETVRWVEEEATQRGERRKVVKMAPILVSPFLRKYLFTKVPCVLTSATLAVKGRFDYITGRLGIDGYEGLDVGTPFDFPSQARLYVPVMLPEPTGADQGVWQAMATEEILRLITISRGRALVLFTSVAHLKAAYDAIRIRTDLDLRKQGDAPTPQLVEWLKDHDGDGPGKVLFATKSFFTGVDISGEALSLVVVTKMPFPVPTEPLTEARCEAIEAQGGSSFADYTIPVMSLILQQAAGRLIRHRSDTGVVAILDPRIVSKNYGKRIIHDLPPMTQTYDMAEVEAFLA